MKTRLKGSIVAGVGAGAVWGWAAMGVNAVSGVFPFEGSFAHNLATFTLAGALFGVVVAASLALFGAYLPFKRALPKAVFLSALLWLLLRVAGAALSHMEPDRYHVLTPETVQGLALAVVLGGILGLFWKKGIERAG